MGFRRREQLAAESPTIEMEKDCSCTLQSTKLSDTTIREAIEEWQNNDAINAAYGEISCWNVEEVTNMDELFVRQLDFNADISCWDVSSVTTMRWMFAYCMSFNSDLSNWNVGSVTDTYNMFFWASSFNSDVSKWDVSHAKHMTRMFYRASMFNSDVSNWNVSNVEDMSSMFEYATSFNSNLEKWDVVSSSTKSMDFMLYGASSFDQKLCWDISSVSQTNNMFTNSLGCVESICCPSCSAELRC